MADPDCADQRRELLIERLPLAYIEFDRDAQLLDWNPAAERIFGHSKHDIVGMNGIELLKPTLPRELLRDILDRIFAGDSDAHCVCQNVTKGGNVIDCRWENTPIPEPGGKVTVAFAIVQIINIPKCSHTVVDLASEHDLALRDQLTARQLAVLRLVVEGHRTKDIATTIGISAKTIEMHRANIMRTLNIHDIPGLVRYAIRVGLISSQNQV